MEIRPAAHAGPPLGLPSYEAFQPDDKTVTMEARLPPRRSAIRRAILNNPFLVTLSVDPSRRRRKGNAHGRSQKLFRKLFLWRSASDRDGRAGAHGLLPLRFVPPMVRGPGQQFYLVET